MKKVIAASLLSLVLCLDSAFALSTSPTTTDNVVTINLVVTSGSPIGSLGYGINNPFMPPIIDGTFISSIVNNAQSATVVAKKTGPAFAGAVTIFPSLETVGWNTNSGVTTFSSTFGCVPAIWDGVSNFSTTCKI